MNRTTNKKKAFRAMKNKVPLVKNYFCPFQQTQASKESSHKKPWNVQRGRGRARVLFSQLEQPMMVVLLWEEDSYTPSLSGEQRHTVCLSSMSSPRGTDWNFQKILQIVFCNPNPRSAGQGPTSDVPLGKFWLMLNPKLLN